MPIVDLCHFGVPDWIGNFQNPDFPEIFARYAKAFAQRFPWVQLYTPVNEMFICAQFSAKYGWWNEEGTTDLTFVTALKHIVKANVRAMQEILKVRADAIFIQSESSEYFHAENPAAIKPAEIENSKRFLSLDLNYGHRVDSEMYEYLLDNGMTREEYHFFLGNSLHHHCILGNDYYWTNEHRVSADGGSRASGEIFGYSEITRQYYNRYRLPVMHTETNIAEGPNGDEAVNWLWKEWANVLRVRNYGVPTVGFTWYSLTDQIDWDVGLREDNGRVHPVGPLRPQPRDPAGGPVLQAADQRLGRGAADPERLPHRARSCRRPNTRSRRPSGSGPTHGSCGRWSWPPARPAEARRALASGPAHRRRARSSPCAPGDAPPAGPAFLEADRAARPRDDAAAGAPAAAVGRDCRRHLSARSRGRGRANWTAAPTTSPANKSFSFGGAILAPYANRIRGRRVAGRARDRDGGGGPARCACRATGAARRRAPSSTPCTA